MYAAHLGPSLPHAPTIARLMARLVTSAAPPALRGLHSSRSRCTAEADLAEAKSYFDSYYTVPDAERASKTDSERVSVAPPPKPPPLSDEQKRG